MSRSKSRSGCESGFKSMFRVGPGLGLALGPCQRTKGFCCPKMISMKKGNIQVSSCHSLASFLTVGKYLDLGFRCSAFASRLSDFWDFVDFLGLLGFQ